MLEESWPTALGCHNPGLLAGHDWAQQHRPLLGLGASTRKLCLELPSVRSRLLQSSHSCSAVQGSSYPLLSSQWLVSDLHYGLKALPASSWSLPPTSFLCFSPNTSPACLISPWHLLIRAPKGTCVTKSEPRDMRQTVQEHRQYGFIL